MRHTKILRNFSSFCRAEEQVKTDGCLFYGWDEDYAEGGYHEPVTGVQN